MKIQTNSFPFSRAVESAIAPFAERTRDILASRFGMDRTDGSAAKKERATLDVIGKRYGITRERTRQIIAAAIAEIAKERAEHLETAEEAIETAIREIGGIVRKDRLLHSLAPDSARDRAAANFVVEYSDRFMSAGRKHRLIPSVALSDFDIEAALRSVSEAEVFLESAGSPISFEEMLSRLGLPKSQLKMHIDITPRISRNPFGKWGLSHWSEISPRGTRDKIHLLLKHYGKPLHFRDIARLIDEHGLSKKRSANPQTVHNELIKSDEFVLVGRGVYGLKER